MTRLIIQLELELDFPATVDGLNNAIDKLEALVLGEFPVASLKVYNLIFAAIHTDLKNGYLSSSDFAQLQSRLVSFHLDVLTLNGVY